MRRHGGVRRRAEHEDAGRRAPEREDAQERPGEEAVEVLQHGRLDETEPRADGQRREQREREEHRARGHAERTGERAAHRALPLPLHRGVGEVRGVRADHRIVRDRASRRREGADDGRGGGGGGGGGDDGATLDDG
eukprot:31374-Pelagococcus_subviridis.AAC.5